MKPTQSESTILHVVLSTAFATIIGAATAGTQFYFAHGQDLWLALAFFGGSLPATFGVLRYAVWHAVQTNPAFAQAEKDAQDQAIAEAKQVGGAALAHIEGWLPFLHWLQAYHATQPALTPQPAQPVLQPSNVPQLAFPLASGGTIAPQSLVAPATLGSTYQQSGLTNTPLNVNFAGGTIAPSTSTFTIPQRSFSDSSLLPAMPKQ